MMSGIDELLNYFFGSSSATVEPAPNRPPPSSDDLKFALDSDAFYGSGIEGLVEPDKKKKKRPKLKQLSSDELIALQSGQARGDLLFAEKDKSNSAPVTDDLAKYIGMQDLARRRSALASLGFDPYEATYVSIPDNEDMTKAGETHYREVDPRTRNVDPRYWAAVKGDRSYDNVGTHEQIHAGIFNLGESLGLPPDTDMISVLRALGKDYGPLDRRPEEEEFIRWISRNVYGDAGKQFNNQKIEDSLDRNDDIYREVYDLLEGPAAKLVASKRRSGPR